MLYYSLKLIKTGELLHREGLVDARAGNLSIRVDDRVFITRTGANLGTLSPEDIVELPLHERHILEERASSEWIVHREIYLQTPHRAIVHTHPLYTVLISMQWDRIEPKDSEGRAILGFVEVIPEYPSGSLPLAQAVAQALRVSKLVVVKGHGVFSAGKDPFEAYTLTSILERSCKLLASLL